MIHCIINHVSILTLVEELEDIPKPNCNFSRSVVVLTENGIDLDMCPTKNYIVVCHFGEQCSFHNIVKLTYISIIAINIIFTISEFLFVDTYVNSY